MLKDVLSRLTESRLFRQARTVWRVASGSGVSRKNEGVDLFLGGQSVQKISALLMPGIGGPALINRQLEIQSEIREYTLGQERRVLELKDEVAELRAALNEAMKAQRHEDTKAAPDLLGELLGIGGAA